MPRLRSVRASTLPELLVAMVLSGFVLFFAYEGLVLLQRRLGTSRHDMTEWQILQSHAVIERLMIKSDSIRFSGSELFFYSSGISSDTLALSRGYVLHRRLGSIDTLFCDSEVEVEMFLSGNSGLVKSLDLFLQKSGNDTLHIRYLSGASSYIESLYRY